MTVWSLTPVSIQKLQTMWTILFLLSWIICWSYYDVIRVSQTTWTTLIWKDFMDFFFTQWPLKNKLPAPSLITAPESLVFADLQWFDSSPRCSDVQVYWRTLGHHWWLVRGAKHRFIFNFFFSLLLSYSISSVCRSLLSPSVHCSPLNLFSSSFFSCLHSVSLLLLSLCFLSSVLSLTLLSLSSLCSGHSLSRPAVSSSDWKTSRIREEQRAAANTFK